jgi:hypothetical protein
MFEDGVVRQAVEAVLAVDVSIATEAELGAACRSARTVRGFLDAFEAAVAHRGEELKANGCGRGGQSLLTRNEKVTVRHARDVLRRSETLAAAPALTAALAGGHVSAGHVDVYGIVARNASEAGRTALVAHQGSLASLAVTQSPEDFALSCKRIVALADDDGGIDEATRQRRATRLRRWRDEVTGMYRLTAAFDPELGVRLWRTIDHAVATHYPKSQRPDSTPDGPDAEDHLAALALVDLATTSHDRTRSRPPRGELTVIIDLDTLRDGLHQASIVEVDPGGHPLPVAALRRLACDADLLPAVLNGDGVVVDVGRSRRLATADQRRALRAMYPGCAISGCRTEFDHCQIHHLHPFTTRNGDGGGRTDLDQLLPLCDRHHHAAHEGHWHLHLDQTSRVLTVTLPDGTTDTHPPPRTRQPTAA